MCFSNCDIELFDNLHRPLEWNKTDESLWSDKCDYLDPTDCKDLNPSNYNLVVMQLNISSLLAHQNKLSELLQVLSTKNSQVDIGVLCETFLKYKTEKLAKIPGYNIICNNHKIAKGGGVTLVRNSITFKKRPDLSCMEEKLIKSVYIEVRAKNGKSYIIGSLYRAPNSEESGLMQHIGKTA